jgi:hypothetical protein
MKSQNVVHRQMCPYVSIRVPPTHTNSDGILIIFGLLGQDILIGFSNWQGNRTQSMYTIVYQGDIM